MQGHGLAPSEAVSPPPRLLSRGSWAGPASAPGGDLLSPVEGGG